jgi:hypothetical protein
LHEVFLVLASVMSLFLTHWHDPGRGFKIFCICWLISLSAVGCVIVRNSAVFCSGVPARYWFPVFWLPFRILAVNPLRNNVFYIKNHPFSMAIIARITSCFSRRLAPLWRLLPIAACRAADCPAAHVETGVR